MYNPSSTSASEPYSHHIQKRKPSHLIQMPASEDDRQLRPGTGASAYNRSSNNSSSSQSSPSPFLKSWGTRHTITLLGFLGFASSYSMRVNLSIAIVSMVNSSSHHNHNHDGFGNTTVACPELIPPAVEGGEINLRQSLPSKFTKFNWSGHEQGIILGSFFYGYVATQVPGGMLANKIGLKWVFGVGMLITAVFSLVTPMAANAGIEWLVLVRIIQGLGEGVTNPAMHALLAQWLPALERSTLGGFVYAGMQIGTVIALPISGWLMGNEDGMMLTSGWPAVFYVFGLLGIVWFGFWAMLVYESPSVHPRISLEELQYIQGNKTEDNRRRVATGQNHGGTPWSQLLTSGPVLAILVAQTGHGWGLYTMLTELPTYMDDVLHFNIKQSSYLSALPYFLMWVVSVASSIYADRMRSRGWSTGTVRKIFNTIAHWCPSLLLVLAANSACDRTLTVVLITLAISINGAAWASFQVNHIDLSPNHAAVMMGITNGFANLCGIGAPYVAGVIINEGSSIPRWRIIFYIAAAVYFFDNCVYLLFASGETQPWDSANCGGDSGSGASDDVLFGPNNSEQTRVRSRYAVNNGDDDDEEDETNNDRSPLLVP